MENLRPDSQVYERLQNAICTLEKFAKIIDQVGSLATSQLESDRQADADSDGLQSQQMNEFLLSSIEKFLGTMETRQNPKDVLRFTSDFFCGHILISMRLVNLLMWCDHFCWISVIDLRIHRWKFRP